MIRRLTLAGLLSLVLAFQGTMAKAAPPTGPLFQAPRQIDGGVSGPWDFAFPVANLNGLNVPRQYNGLRPPIAGDDGYGLAVAGKIPDLALIGCPTPGCPSTDTMSILEGDGHGNFTVTQRTHAGNYPTGIATGDFNGDSRTDLVVSEPVAPGSTALSQILVYMQTTSGTLVPGPTYTLALPQVRGAQAVDVNRDGKVDVVAGMGSGTAINNVQVLLGRGDGSFDVQPSFGTCTTAHFFKGFADLDRNGTPDFAIACASSSSVAVFLGDGSGRFTQRTLTGIVSAHNAGLADFNRDGNVDIAVTSRTGVHVFLGDGAGNFVAAPGSPYSVGYPPGTSIQTTLMVIGQFASPNSTMRDMIPDIAVSNSSVNFSNSSVSVLIGQGDGRLVNASAMGSPFEFGPGTAFNTWGVAAGDWNGDRKLDLAVAGGVTSRAANTVTLLLHS